MLTQLSTLKSRLGLIDTDPQYDSLLTNAIHAVSARFDHLCRRVLARTVNATAEFSADALSIQVAAYPIESISKFDLKTAEAEGWIEQPGVACLVRQNCVVCLAAPLGVASQQARLTYTGGYVLPGASPGPGQTPLPADLEQAAIEQVVFWFQTRDHVGVMREWPKGGVYEQFADLDLLPSVRAVLKQYERWEV